jgi:hypothetical protein
LNLRAKFLLVVALLSSASVAQAGVPSAADIKLTKVVDVAKMGEVHGFQIPGTKTTLLVFYNQELAHTGHSTNVFLGSDKVLFQQDSLDSIESPQSLQPPHWALRMVAPRSTWHISVGFAQLEHETGAMSLWCGPAKKVSEEKPVVLTPLPEKSVRAIVASATFRTSAMLRLPVALSRDDAGVYYYVDRLRDDLGGEGFRVLVGKRGAMKQLPLVDVANDNVGMVFATSKGDLRLTVNKAKSEEPSSTVWANKKTIVTLRNVGVDPSSWYLIYRDLGVYGAMGVLCEDR